MLNEKEARQNLEETRIAFRFKDNHEDLTETYHIVFDKTGKKFKYLKAHHAFTKDEMDKFAPMLIDLYGPIKTYGFTKIHAPYTMGVARFGEKMLALAERDFKNYYAKANYIQMISNICTMEENPEKIDLLFSKIEAVQNTKDEIYLPWAKEQAESQMENFKSILITPEEAEEKFGDFFNHTTFQEKEITQEFIDNILERRKRLKHINLAG